MTSSLKLSAMLQLSNAYEADIVDFWDLLVNFIRGRLCLAYCRVPHLQCRDDIQFE